MLKVHKTTTLSTARKQLRDAVFNSQDDLLLQAPPGVGKSHVLLEYAASINGAVLYTLPYKTLLWEFKEQVERYFSPSLVSICYGRDRKNCLDFDNVREALKLGYPSSLICMLCTAPAAQRKPCPYLTQLKRASERGGLVLLTPALLPVLLNKLYPRAVIIDEQVEKLFSYTTFDYLLLHHLKSFLKDERVRTAIDKLIGLIETAAQKTREGKKWRILYLSSKKDQKAPYLWDAASIGAKEILQESFEDGELGDLWSTDRGYLWKELKAPLNALTWLRRAALDEGSVFIAVSSKQIQLGYFNDPIQLPETARVLAADASVLPDVASKLLGRELKVVKPKVAPNLIALTVRIGASKYSAQRDRRKLEKTLNVFERLAKKIPEGKKMLIFAHKAFRPHVFNICKEVLGDRVEWAVEGHFGTRSRGSNQYKDYDCVFVLLRPSTEPTRYWPLFHWLGYTEPQKAAFLEHKLMTEVQQEAFRVRPLEAERPKIVVVIGDMSGRLVENALTPAFHAYFSSWQNQHKTLKAALLLIAWLRVFNFADIAIALALGIGRKEQIPSKETRETWWKAVHKCFPAKFERFLASVKNLVTQMGIKEAEILFENLNKGEIPSLFMGVERYINILDLRPPMANSTEITLDNGNQTQSGEKSAPWGVKGIKSCQNSLLSIISQEETLFENSKWWRDVRKTLHAFADPDRNVETYVCGFPLRYGKEEVRMRIAKCLGSKLKAIEFYKRLKESGLLKRLPDFEVGKEKGGGA